jgi:ribosomal protein L31
MSSPFTPHRNEDEYFLKQDAELIKELRAKLDAEREAAERKAHYMKCPKCGSDLTETVFQQVKIDVCGQCHGMWLDAGELEMISKVRESAVGSFLRDILTGLRRT